MTCSIMLFSLNEFLLSGLMQVTSLLRTMKFMIVLMVWVFCRIFLGEFTHMVCWKSYLCYNLVDTIGFMCFIWKDKLLIFSNYAFIVIILRKLGGVA